MTFELYCYLAVGAVICAFTGVLCSVSMTGILQQSGYSGKGFLRWYCRYGNMMPGRNALLSLTLLLLVALVNLCFSFLGYAWANLISVLPFLGLSVLYYFSSKRAVKVPLKCTNRAIRLSVCYFLFLFAVAYGMGIGFSFAAVSLGKELGYLLRYALICLLPNFYPFVLVAANTVMLCYELPHNRAYIRKAKKALAASDCIKVGITGSFAKTSVKNIARAILSVRYNVIATPASYNTPIGLGRAVKENGLDCDVFLAEMGARKEGDIRELCDMVNPEYGVVTGICPQHLQTFGTMRAIVKEKGVLASRAKKGCVVGESAYAAGIGGALIAGRDFAAEEVERFTDGTKFTLCLGEEKIRVETALLGRTAAEDIALAAALCSLLGMSVKEIKAGISLVSPVPHRLQKLEDNGLFILDDSYNSNIEGAKDAVETLRLFGGKRYIVTPGLVELGHIEGKANEELGASLVGLDAVILVGETLVLSVRRGYLAAGGDAQKLRVVPSLAAAKKILSEELGAGDCVLFLNDLPDLYN